MRPPVIRLGGIYAAYFAALGILVPFWPLYLEAQGYRPLEIGALMAIVPATKVLSPAFWGWVADRRGQLLPLIRWCSFLAWASLAGLPWLGTGPERVGLALVSFGFFWNGSLPLVETLTLAHLRGRGGYGRVRLWGSVGFAVTVGVGGVLLGEALPLSQVPMLTSVLLFGQWLMALSLPGSSGVPQTPTVTPSFVALLAKPAVLTFFLAALLSQLAHGPYYAFYSLYLKASGHSDARIGELWALGILAEVVLFALMDRLERQFGIRFLFLAGLIACTLRWPLMAGYPDQTAVLVVAQLLHAGSFGLMHATAIALVHRHFPGRHHALGQALLSALVYGLGGALGSLFSGVLWDLWPAFWVFTAASGLSLVALMVAWPWVGRVDPIPASASAGG